MTFNRRIRYRLDNYKRLVVSAWRGDGFPAWMSGRTARFAYLITFGILLITYVCQVSSAAGIGYEMRDLQRKNELLHQEIRQLNVEVATFNALPNLEARIPAERLLRVSNIIYMSAADSVVAKK